MLFGRRGVPGWQRCLVRSSNKHATVAEQSRPRPSLRQSRTMSRPMMSDVQPEAKQVGSTATSSLPSFHQPSRSAVYRTVRTFACPARNSGARGGLGSLVRPASRSSIAATIRQLCIPQAFDCSAAYPEPMRAVWVAICCSWCLGQHVLSASKLSFRLPLHPWHLRHIYTNTLP